MSTRDTGNGLPRWRHRFAVLLGVHEPTDENRAEIAGEITATPNDMPAALTPCPELPLLLDGFEIPTNRAGSLGSGVKERNPAGEAELGRPIVGRRQPPGGQSSEWPASATFLRLHVPDSQFPFSVAERGQDIGKPACAAVFAVVEDRRLDTSLCGWEPGRWV